MRPAWDVIRSRFILRACDAILTASPHLAAAEGERSGRRSNYRRMHSLVRATDAILPASVAWARRRLRQQRLLPFADGLTDVLGFGSGSTVYLLERRTGVGEPDLVLKVYRATLGRELPALLRHAHTLRERHRLVCAWYAGTSVAVPVEYVILHGPLLDQPAVAGLQPYVAGEKWDFFEFVQAHDFPALVREQPSLRAQFQQFVERTVAVLSAEERCLDLIGWGNLLVVRRDGGLSLQVIDYGVLDLRQQRLDAPPRAAAAMERVTCLRRLHEEIFGHAALVGGSDARRG